MRPLRRRRGIGTNRPSSEDRSLASARRPGSSSCEASPLRDSAGISPASLGTAPSWEATTPGRRKPIAADGLTGATTAHDQPGYRKATADRTHRRPTARSRPLHLIPGGAWDPGGPCGLAGLGDHCPGSAPDRPAATRRGAMAKWRAAHDLGMGTCPAGVTLARQRAADWERPRSLHDLQSMGNAVCNTRS